MATRGLRKRPADRIRRRLVEGCGGCGVILKGGEGDVDRGGVETRRGGRRAWTTCVRIADVLVLKLASPP